MAIYLKSARRLFIRSRCLSSIIQWIGYPSIPYFISQIWLVNSSHQISPFIPGAHTTPRTAFPVQNRFF